MVQNQQQGNRQQGQACLELNGSQDNPQRFTQAQRGTCHHEANLRFARQDFLQA